MAPGREPAGRPFGGRLHECSVMAMLDGWVGGRLARWHARRVIKWLQSGPVLPHAPMSPCCHSQARHFQANMEARSWKLEAGIWRDEARVMPASMSWEKEAGAAPCQRESYCPSVCCASNGLLFPGRSLRPLARPGTGKLLTTTTLVTVQSSPAQSVPLHLVPSSTPDPKTLAFQHPLQTSGWGAAAGRSRLGGSQERLFKRKPRAWVIPTWAPKGCPPKGQTFHLAWR